MLRFLSSPLRRQFASTGGYSFGSDNGPVSRRTRLWPPAHTTMMATSNFVLPSFVSATENFFSGSVLLTGLCELMSPCSLLWLRKKPFSLSLSGLCSSDKKWWFCFFDNNSEWFEQWWLLLLLWRPSASRWWTKTEKKNIFSLADQQFRWLTGDTTTCGASDVKLRQSADNPRFFFSSRFAFSSSSCRHVCN